MLHTQPNPHSEVSVSDLPTCHTIAFHHNYYYISQFKFTHIPQPLSTAHDIQAIFGCSESLVFFIHLFSFDLLLISAQYPHLCQLWVQFHHTSLDPYNNPLTVKIIIMMLILRIFRLVDSAKCESVGLNDMHLKQWYSLVLCIRHVNIIVVVCYSLALSMLTYCIENMSEYKTHRTISAEMGNFRVIRYYGDVKLSKKLDELNC